MNKEYRLELRQLRQAERKIRKDWKAQARTITKQTRALDLALSRCTRACTRQLALITRRQSILNGRLS